MADARTQEFTTRIQLDRLTAPAADPLGACLEWPDPATLGPFAAGGWKADKGLTVLDTPGEVERGWLLENGDERATLTVFVSSEGSGPARERLVKQAAATMTRSIPYHPAATKLGDIAVVLTGPTIQDLIWVRHNVCVQIVIDGPQPDVFAIARELDARIEKASVPDWKKRVPAIASAKANRESAAVGEVVRIDVSPAPGVDAGKCTLQMFEKVPGVSLGRKQAGATFVEFDALEPGDTQVEVALADPKTLLSSWAQVKLQVRPR